MYFIKEVLGCNNNEDVKQTAGADPPRQDLMDAMMSCMLYVIKILFEKLDLLSEIAKLIDGLMNALARSVLADPAKTACQTCAIANSVADTVSDVAKTLTVDTCVAFLDMGQGMCKEWDLGWEKLVPRLFTSLYGNVKLGFMLALTLPAMAELTLEWGVLFSGTLIQIFPDLLADSFQIIMWVISSSSVLEMLEPMFEAIDPLVTQLGAGLKAVPNCASQTLQKQGTAGFKNREGPTSVPATGVALGGATLCKPPAPEDGVPSCNGMNSETDFERPNSGETLSTIPGTPQDMNIDELKRNIAACGCVPKPPDCAGADSGGAACKYQTGDYDAAIKAKADKTGKMKGCPGGGILAQGATGGSRRRPSPAADPPPAGGSCDMKSLRPKADVVDDTPNMFADFSNDQQNYGFVLLDDQGQPPSAKPHFRNLLWEDPNPKVTARPDPLAGLRLLGNKGPTGESHFDRESRNVAEGIANFTALYASMVVAINEAGLPLLAASGWRAEIIRASDTLASASRSLLAGAPKRYDAQLENTTCASGGTVEIDDPDNPGAKLTFKASTWACCRGLWCCIPPLPQDFRFQSRWLRWRSTWYSDTKCEFVDSWPKAAAYGVRALFKLLHDATLTVDRWPLDGALSWLYDQVSFEDGEWPEQDPGIHATCLVMNSGYVWMLFALLLTLMLIAGPCSDFAIAVAMWLLDCMQPLLLLIKPLCWCGTSISNLKAKKSE